MSDVGQISRPSTLDDARREMRAIDAPIPVERAGTTVTSVVSSSRPPG